MRSRENSHIPTMVQLARPFVRVCACKGLVMISQRSRDNIVKVVMEVMPWVVAGVARCCHREKRTGIILGLVGMS